MKKLLNINVELIQGIEDLIKKNKGLSFSMVVNQAIKNFLNNPKIDLEISTNKRIGKNERLEMMEENKELLVGLSK